MKHPHFQPAHVRQAEDAKEKRNQDVQEYLREMARRRANPPRRVLRPVN